MARLKGKTEACRPLFTLLLLLPLSSCGTHGPDQAPAGPVTPEARAQSLLVSLAGLNPRVAEPLVKGFSAAALERAVVLVVNTGVDEARWAEGLLAQRWWVLDDPSTRLLGPDGVSRVLSEVQRKNPQGGFEGEARQREIRAELGNTLAPEAGSEESGGTVEVVRKGAVTTEREGDTGTGPDYRAELEDAVRWVQFTQAWSSYYAAADALSSGKSTSSEGSRVALDQAVTMSLVRPDFLDRLAVLMAEGLGS